FHYPPTTALYALSLHDALPILIGRLSAAIGEVTGLVPELSTSGGTSDARFIKDYCPVVEFGLVGQTMHMIDEHVPLADLETLTRSEEHTSELQSRENLVCRLLL